LWKVNNKEESVYVTVIAVCLVQGLVMD